MKQMGFFDAAPAVTAIVAAPAPPADLLQEQQPAADTATTAAIAAPTSPADATPERPQPVGIPAAKPVGAMGQEFRRRVLNFIGRRGPKGAADGEIAQGLGLSIETARMRRRGLLEAGLIVDSGDRRADLCGALTAVWILADGRYTRSIDAPPGPVLGREETTPPQAPGPAVHRDAIRPPHVPSARGSETSMNAAAGIAPHAGQLQAAVYRFIAERSDTGATDHEIADCLGMFLDSARARRCELRDRGEVTDSGRRRPTPSGRQAVVWIATGKAYGTREGWAEN